MTEQEIQTTELGGDEEATAVIVKDKKQKKGAKDMDDLKKEAEMVSSVI